MPEPKTIIIIVVVIVLFIGLGVGGYFIFKPSPVVTPPVTTPPVTTPPVTTPPVTTSPGSTPPVATPVSPITTPPTPTAVISSPNSVPSSQAATVPVNCQVSGWSEYGPCSATQCGTTGTKSRSRTITTPASQGGTACPSLSESIACSSDPCPIAPLTPTVSYNYKENTYLAGGSGLLGGVNGVPNGAACETLCSNNSGCKGFYWWPGVNNCYYQGGSPTWGPDGAISGAHGGVKI